MSESLFTSVMDRVSAETIITVRRHTTPAATYEIAMGPFPARIHYRPSGAVELQVIVARMPLEAVDGIADKMAAIPYPAPILRKSLKPVSTITIIYTTAIQTFSVDEAVGIIAAGAMYGDALARSLFPDISAEWSSHLGSFGISAARPHRDPRDQLRKAEIQPWPNDVR